MKHGGFRSHNLLDDALTIAIVESGVALRAFDADRVTGRPGIRPADAGEELEGRPGELPGRHAGDRRRAAPAGAALRRHGGRAGASSPKTKRTLLVAIQVAGVPDDRGRGGAVACRGVLRGVEELRVDLRGLGP